MTNSFLRLRGEHLPFVLVAFSFAGGSLASLEPGASKDRTHRAATAAEARENRLAQAFEWPGTDDLIGTGFATGDRFAVLTVTPRDTSFDFQFNGPPGSLTSLQVAGDSAHVVWNMEGPVMMIDVRGTGDSLDGAWSMGEESGQVYGTRRRRASTLDTRRTPGDDRPTPIPCDGCWR